MNITQHTRKDIFYTFFFLFLFYSIPFFLSTISFWNVPKYCPLIKVNSHYFHSLPVLHLKNQLAFSICFIQIWIKEVIWKLLTFYVKSNALNNVSLKIFSKWKNNLDLREHFPFDMVHSIFCAAMKRVQTYILIIH